MFLHLEVHEHQVQSHAASAPFQVRYAIQIVQNQSLHLRQSSRSILRRHHLVPHLFQRAVSHLQDRQRVVHQKNTKHSPLLADFVGASTFHFNAFFSIGMIAFVSNDAAVGLADDARRGWSYFDTRLLASLRFVL